MANIKSAKKRIKVTATKNLRNKSLRTAVKTQVKKLEAAIEAQDQAVAKDELNKTISAINRATTKGIFHKKTASRKISRFTKRVNAI